MVKLDDGEVYDIVRCLAEAIGGAPISDCDENIEEKVKAGETYVTILEWAERWDTAIAFHNEHCEPSQRFSDPWVVKTLKEITGEL